MKRIAQILLTAFVAASAHVASALNYSPADLLLVFHKSGNNDVIFDIGPVAGFSGLAAGTVVPVSYDTSLVSSNFGGSLSGVSFAVVGEKDSQSHVWLTDADTNSIPNEPTPSTYATVQAKVNSVGVNAALATGNNGSPFVVDPSDAHSYSFIVSPDDSIAISTMEGNAPYVVSSVAPATAALYQLYPSLYSPTPTEVKLGTFTLAAGGALSFTAAAVTPEITTLSGPGGATARGGTATYSVTADGATSFQWYLNGVAIAGATNSSLSVTNVQPGDAGNYTVAVNNSTYATTTTSAAKTLTETPAYISGDLLLVFHDGINSDVEFNLGSVSGFQGLSAGSSKAVNYNKALVLSNFGGSLTGVTAAFVAESDAQGSIWLSDANLNTVGPDITVGTYAPLQGELNNVGVSAATVDSSIDFNNPVVLQTTDARGWSFIVSHDDPTAVNSMDGNAPFTVGKSFPGYAGFYQLSPNVAGTFAGVFVLEADGDISFTALTNTSVITAAAAPTIITQPAPLSLTTNEGAAKTYTVVATNSFSGGSAFDLSYQWRLNGTNIPGATGTSYTDSNLQAADVGSYSVVVSSILGSTTSSNALLALVLDSTIPTVAIKTPVANGFSISGLVSGTATDAKVGGKVLLSKVFYGVDGSAVTNLATGTTNWTFSIAGATPGNHTVVAQAQDLAGNLSLARSNTFFYGVSSVLTIVTNGNGLVKGMGPTTFGTAAGGASLVIGKSYKLQVTAAGNYLFSNIVDSAAGPTTVSTYTFTMQSNLTLTVNFVTNRFFDAAGTYYGLITGTNGITFDDSGFFTVKVTGKTNKLGTFSGTVYLSGNSKGFSGTIGLNGVGTTAPVDRSKWPGKDPLTLKFVLPFDTSDTISGSVSNNNTTNGWISTLTGDRAIATNTYNGHYTMVVPGDATNSVNVPGGSGFGLVYVTNGTITTAGSKLADFQGLTAVKSSVTKNGIWHLYSRADNAGNGQFNSLIMGDVTVSNLTGTLTWIKEPVAIGRYQAGFGVEADVYGSPYFADGNTALATQLVVPLTGGLGNLTLEGAGLPATITQTNSLTLLSGKNKFIFGVKTNNPNTIALNITPATGKVSGTFKPATGPFATSTTPIYGVVVTNLNSFRGFFTPLVGNVNQSGSFELNP